MTAERGMEALGDAAGLPHADGERGPEQAGVHEARDVPAHEVGEAEGDLAALDLGPGERLGVGGVGVGHMG